MAIVANNIADKVRVAFSKDARDTIAHAATEAIRTVGDLLKLKGRQNIGAAGFSSRWQNAWRVNIYPSKKESINAAAFGFHRISYSLVFEEGARIVGKSGLLWIPLRSTPKNGRNRATARGFIERGIKMFSLNRPGKLPLLATNVRLSEAQRSNSGLKLSLSKLRRGSEGKRGKVSAVPLFVGLKQVTIQKRFNISGVAQDVSKQLASLYFSKVQTDGR